MCPSTTLPNTYCFRPTPSPQLSLDPPGPKWDGPLGCKVLEDEEGPWGGDSGLPPPACFPGSWRLDVGLDCKGSPEGAEARAWTAYYYSLLQSCLQQAGLPETQDRSQVPRTGAQGLHGGGTLGSGEGGAHSPSPRLWLGLESGEPGTCGRAGIACGSGQVRGQGSP